MSTIKFFQGEGRRFLTYEDLAAEKPEIRDSVKHLPASELVGAACYHHEGSDTEPQLFEVELPANHEVEAHAHRADEIIAVVAGSLQFGKQSFGVGSSVFIPGMTLYSFRTGPEGVRFLNFRPTRALGAIFKDDFMAMRAAGELDRSDVSAEA